MVDADRLATPFFQNFDNHAAFAQPRILQVTGYILVGLTEG